MNETGMIYKMTLKNISGFLYTVISILYNAEKDLHS